MKELELILKGKKSKVSFPIYVKWGCDSVVRVVNSCCLGDEY